MFIILIENDRKRIESICENENTTRAGFISFSQIHLIDFPNPASPQNYFSVDLLLFLKLPSKKR